MLGGDDGDKAWIDEVVDDRRPRATGSSTARASCRAASSSASPSPARWPAKPDDHLRRRADRQPRLADSGAEILDFMRRAVDEFGQTIVMVTHDPIAAVVRRPRRVPRRRPDRRRDARADRRAGARPHEAASATDDEQPSRPSSSPGGASAPASGGSIAIAIAILVGVSFVVGSFVLADSLRDDVRRPVHRAQRRTSTSRSARRWRSATSTTARQRDPIPASLADDGRGRSTASPPPSRRCSATPSCIDTDGEAVEHAGRADARRRRGPATPTLVGRRRSRTGAAADRRRPGGHRQGDRRPRGLRGRRPDHDHHRHRHAHVHDHRRSSASATADGFGGATLAALRPRRPRSRSLGAGGTYDAHRHRASPTAPTSAPCRQRIEQVLPDAHRGRHRRAGSSRRQGRRVDTFISVVRHRPARSSPSSPPSSARSSSTTCSHITIGQRLRELALMRGRRRHTDARCGG